MISCDSPKFQIVFLDFQCFLRFVQLVSLLLDTAVFLRLFVNAKDVLNVSMLEKAVGVLVVLVGVLDGLVDVLCSVFWLFFVVSESVACLVADLFLFQSRTRNKNVYTHKIRKPIKDNNHGLIFDVKKVFLKQKVVIRNKKHFSLKHTQKYFHNHCKIWFLYT